MGCGCGKGREGTAEVKELKRQQMMGGTGRVNAPLNDAGYNRRVSDYNQTLREFMRKR